jgi:glycosyltransferase involved in cell wall biosynthesis
MGRAIEYAAGGADVGRPTLAVVAIAKNEERDLPGFLSNVASWVEEIVIVDDGSTDGTLEIIKAAGRRVRLVERRMDESGFAGQRNAGIDAAISDWLLHMDIDERVTPELAGEIAAALGNERLNGYRYRRLNFFLHRPMRAGGWQRWNNPQLARRSKHRFENTIHERCVIEGGDAATGQLRGFMWHLNDEDYVERVGKNLRYMQMSGEEILARGTRVRWYHLLFDPAYRAFKSFVLQQGYREGVRGLILALYTFSGTFNRWAYAWDRQNRVARSKLEEDLRRSWAANPAPEGKTHG